MGVSAIRFGGSFDSYFGGYYLWSRSESTALYDLVSSDRLVFESLLWKLEELARCAMGTTVRGGSLGGRRSELVGAIRAD